MFKSSKASSALVVALLSATWACYASAQTRDKSAGLDQYEQYARWWKERHAKKPIPRNKDGSRKGFFGVRFNPTPMSADTAETSGLVHGPTFVLGVAIGDESRAWPLHAIGELQNDVVGGVPIAASW